MTTIKTVAIAGASGNVGPSLVKQLLEDGFQVTALTRKGATHTFPASVTAVEVDYASPASLEAALRGQDAVISAVGFDGLPQQLPLVSAAAAAGVKRFLPSEFGGDATNEKTSALPPFEPKKAVLDALRREAAGGKMTYTLISTGPFLDMGLRFGMFVDAKNKTANLYDGGDVRFSTTTLESVAKAVSGVLRNLEATENRNVRVHSVSTTQNALLAKAKKAVGTDGWTVNVVKTDDVLAGAHAKLKETGEVDRIGFIVSAVWGQGYGSDFQDVDNELVGVRKLTEDEVQSMVDSVAK
ncbi:NAD(P)-binding protein [Hypoxylon sp. FL1284]|nr:NAD(P)-binding protein [Hypoxylon sp. FL1284]